MAASKVVEEPIGGAKPDNYLLIKDLRVLCDVVGQECPGQLLLQAKVKDPWSIGERLIWSRLNPKMDQEILPREN